jgi:nicotinamide-nucleotide amidase
LAILSSCCFCLLTQESGASDYFDRGFITYSNQAKVELLGVKKSTLDTYGAVSEQTALEMVKGVIRNSNADIGVSITGIAGPTGGIRIALVVTISLHSCVSFDNSL